MELYHHGILGQKWGIRRFQNKDGSLTAEGIKRYRTDLKFKARYDKQVARREAAAAEKAKQKEIKRVETLMKKDTRKLTEAELNERLRRLDMEKKAADIERDMKTSELEMKLIKDDMKRKGKNNQQQNQNQNQNQNNQKTNLAKGIASTLVAGTAMNIARGISNNLADKAVKAIFKSKEAEKGAQYLYQMRSDIPDVKDMFNNGKFKSAADVAVKDLGKGLFGKSEKKNGNWSDSDSYISVKGNNGFEAYSMDLGRNSVSKIFSNHNDYSSYRSNDINNSSSTYTGRNSVSKIFSNSTNYSSFRSNDWSPSSSVDTGRNSVSKIFSNNTDYSSYRSNDIGSKASASVDTGKSVVNSFLSNDTWSSTSASFSVKSKNNQKRYLYSS